jgi:hypothetical protein
LKTGQLLGSLFRYRVPDIVARAGLPKSVQFADEDGMPCPRIRVLIEDLRVGALLALGQIAIAKIGGGRSIGETPFDQIIYLVG